MSKKIVILSLGLMLSIALAVTPERNGSGADRPDDIPAFYNPRSSELAMPTRMVNEPDVPPGTVENQAAPAQGEPPQILEMSDQGNPAEPRPLWGQDIQVYSGVLRSPISYGGERMIAYDQTSTGTLFAAFVMPTGDTMLIYRSTDNGNTWHLFNAVMHPGFILSSPELVVAQGDSSFVFLFLRTSANNGDIYCARFGLTSGAQIFAIKADADTVVNLAACRDNGNPYYLYVTYEYHNGRYNVGLFRSTDYGKHWTPPTSFVIDTRVPPKPDVAVGYNNRVYVSYLDKRLSSVDSAAFRIKRSTDRGENWEQSRQVGAPNVRVFDGVIGARSDRQTLWLVHVRDMEPFNGKGLGVFYYYTAGNDTVFRYGHDDGIGHLDTDNNEQMPSIATLHNGDAPTVAYAIVPSDSLMFTWCSGDTNWTMPINVNDYRHTGSFPPAAGWKTIGGSNYSTVLYAGAGPRNLWFDSWDNTTGIAEGKTGLSRSLVRVRPNPAKGAALLSWAKPASGSAELVIWDITGREVSRLRGATGAVWDCARVPAGVYLFRLEAASETGTIVVTH